MEGNLRMEQRQEIVLDLKIPHRILHSHKFIVKKVSSENLYYDFKYAYDLNFVYVDKPDLEELDQEEKLLTEQAESDAEKKEIKAKIDKKKKNIEIEYHNALRTCKRRLRKWVLGNRMYSRVEKKTKILVIDKQVKILQESEQYLDSYPFSIRTQTCLDKEIDILLTYKPHIILFQHTPISIQEMRENREEEADIVETVADEFKKGNDTVLRCLNKINSMDKYDPMVVVFNYINLDEELALNGIPSWKS